MTLNKLCLAGLLLAITATLTFFLTSWKNQETEPKSVAQCLNMLRGFAPLVDWGVASHRAVIRVRNMGKVMGIYCRKKRFGDAFEVYQTIGEVLTSPELTEDEAKAKRLATPKTEKQCLKMLGKTVARFHRTTHSEWTANRFQMHSSLMQNYCKSGAFDAALNSYQLMQDELKFIVHPVDPSKKPTSRQECFQLMQTHRQTMSSGRVLQKNLKKVRPMFRAMRTYCRAERYEDAFTLFKSITNTLKMAK